MRILILGINYAPELTATGKYTGEMAEWLAEKGHEVRVVTAPPYYPGWRVGPGYSGMRYRREWIAGVSVWRCPLWVPRCPSGWKRLVHLGSFALFSFPIVLRNLYWRPRIIWVVEPPLFCAPVAWIAARLCGAKCWLHVQDFEVDAAFDLGLLPARFWGWVKAVERVVMQRFDRVSTISQRMLDRVAGKGVAEENRVFFPNWVDTGTIYPLDRPSVLRSDLGIPQDKVVVLYAGNMGEKQGLEIILDVARRLERDRGIQFVLCGDGGVRPRLEKMAAGLRNIRWLPLQPFERLNDLLNLADIHLLPQRAGVADLVMPSKLTGMLASGRPVIATAPGETEVANVVGQAGVVVPPGDVGAFVDALQLLASHPERRVELGTAGRRYAERELAKDVVLGKFEEELQRVVHAVDRRT